MAQALYKAQTSTDSSFEWQGRGLPASSQCSTRPRRCDFPPCAAQVSGKWLHVSLGKVKEMIIVHLFIHRCVVHTRVCVCMCNMCMLGDIAVSSPRGQNSPL